MNELKDIRGAQDIQIDFLMHGIVFFSIVLFIALLIFLLKRKKKKLNTQELCKKALKELDFSSENSSKELAYTFTVLGKQCVQSHYEDEFLKIVATLEEYKYKKTTQDLSDAIKNDMQEYIKVRL